MRILPSLLILPFLSLGSIAMAVEIVVDNDSGAPGYIESGSWTTSSSTGYQGGTYRYVLGVAGPTTASATWTPDLPSQGLYEVYAAYRQSTNRSTAAPMTIAHSTGTTIVSLNQNGSNQIVENLLGTFVFDVGTSGFVRMDNGGAADNLIADAIIWRTPIDPPPTISQIARSPEIATSSDPVTVIVTITDNIQVFSATLSFTVSPSGTTGTIPAFDDGDHGDGVAGDSVFGASIPAQPDGSIVAYCFLAADDLGQFATSPTLYYGVGPLPLYQVDTVVDNDDGEPGYAEAGMWTTSTSTGYKGGSYRYSTASSGVATSTATWTPNLPQSGVYRIFAAFARGSNRPTRIPLTITHSLGQSVVHIDQTGSSAVVEIPLGDFPFDAGSNGSIRMENNGSAGAYIADAMIWHLPSDTPPSIYRVSRLPVVPGATDSVQVTAIVTDNVTVATASINYTIDGAGPVMIPAFDDGLHGDGLAGDSIYGASIPAQPDGALVRFTFNATDNRGQSTVSTFQSYVVAEEPRTVYVILSSDTSVWSIAGGHYGTASWDVFESRTGVMSKVYDKVFRYSHIDSLGNPFKITWFMHGGAWFRTAVNSTPISALYHIRRNWEEDIETWGDALEYHFHHYVWDGSNWAMAPTFAETIWEYEWVMSQMMLEENLFVTSFRSGWNYMDNTYQHYLERWVPFRMEGVQSNWVPYHPSFDDYRAPGAMKGWEVRHIYMKSFSASRANQIFAAASLGTDQVACIWSHQNEPDYPEQIAEVDRVLHNAQENYPMVQFLYCSAREAMQKWLNHTSSTPPPLEVESSLTGDDVDVFIHTLDDIYQEQPWVAARRHTGDCVRLDAAKTAPGIWEFDYSRQEYDRVAVGVSDIYGNGVIVPVRDESYRWTVQSDFAQGSSWRVDFDTTPTCAVLQNIAGAYVPSGTLDFDFRIEEGETWVGIRIEAETPEGTSLQTRYKMAHTQALLDEASWSDYSSEASVGLPSGSPPSWIRMEVLLEGTPSSTPEMRKLEIVYRIPPTSGVGFWRIY